MWHFAALPFALWLSSGSFEKVGLTVNRASYQRLEKDKNASSLYTSEKNLWDLSDHALLKIGHRIWQNTCKKRRDQITFWHEKRQFPSIGIAHFNWLPASYQGPNMENTFADFLTFAAKKRVDIPTWLKKNPYCPWSKRALFYEEFYSPKMQELRLFLLDTIPIQVEYIRDHLQNAWQKLLNKTKGKEKDLLIHRLSTLASQKNGIYSLFDYSSVYRQAIQLPYKKSKGLFKDPSKDQENTGVFQVLQEIDEKIFCKRPEKAFFLAATNLIKKQAEKAPKNTSEVFFLPVWLKRLETYRDSQ